MTKTNSPKLRPILFSTPMVQAILEGRKTQTRRIFKDHPRLASDTSKIDLKQWLKDYEGLMHSYCQHGKPGDVLWVREKWAPIIDGNGERLGFFHSTDQTIGYLHGRRMTLKWKPSIHMPFEAARIFLRIKSLRIERLHEISEEDAITEGILKLDEEAFVYDDSPVSFASALSAFRALWRENNGADSWELNPWVWVIEFERITKEQALREVGHA